MHRVALDGQVHAGVAFQVDRVAELNFANGVLLQCPPLPHALVVPLGMDGLALCGQTLASVRPQVDAISGAEATLGLLRGCGRRRRHRLVDCRRPISDLSRAGGPGLHRPAGEAVLDDNTSAALERDLEACCPDRTTGRGEPCRTTTTLHGISLAVDLQSSGRNTLRKVGEDDLGVPRVHAVQHSRCWALAIGHVAIHGLVGDGEDACPRARDRLEGIRMAIERFRTPIADDLHNPAPRAPRVRRRAAVVRDSVARPACSSSSVQQVVGEAVRTRCDIRAGRCGGT
mmetsp:Transcript_107243/g.300282  ORF Transcript_107243/g.300282 Transcript_107243/m.300282 type:complete len:286 (+) Transcript_107243:305-1162(+)